MTAAAPLATNAAASESDADKKKARYQANSTDVQTFYGPIKFDARGANLTKAMVVEQIQGGKRVTIWPVDVANAKGAWPSPEWGKH